MENAVVTLDSVDVGSTVVVSGLKGAGAVRRRLMDMGVLPRAELFVVRKAPMGDPIEIRVRGYNLTLRKNEAETIEVSGEAL